MNVRKTMNAIHQELKNGKKYVQATIPGFVEDEKININRTLVVSVQRRLDMLINLMPSGELRNQITDDNIKLLDVLYN